MDRLHLVTFDAGDTGHKRMADRIAWQADAARAFGCFDTIVTLGPDCYMDGVFPTVAAEALSQRRGAGLWAWKPYIILRRLLEIDPGDTLLYLDGDLAFAGNPVDFTSRAKDLGVATFRYGPEFNNKRFTKRDCLIRLDADREPFLSAPQVWAAVVAAHKRPSAVMLIVDWLLACCLPGILMDGPSNMAPDHDGFQEHRYDQSVLSIVLMKAGFDTVPNELAHLFAHPPV